MRPMWRESAVVTELIERADNARYGDWFPTIEVETEKQTLTLNCSVVIDEKGQRNLEVLHGDFWVDDSTMRTLTWEEINEIEKIIN